MIRNASYSVLAVHSKDGKSITELWSRDYKTDREDGPAVLTREIATGIVTSEKWFTRGLNIRKDGPALVQRDPATGMVTLEMWFQRMDGDLDRTDGPALIARDKVTGEIVETSWWHRGHPVREPGRSPLAALRSHAPAGVSQPR